MLTQYAVDYIHERDAAALLEHVVSQTPLLPTATVGTGATWSWDHVLALAGLQTKVGATPLAVPMAPSSELVDDTLALVSLRDGIRE